MNLNNHSIGLKLNNCDFLDELEEKLKSAMVYGRNLRNKLVSKQEESDEDK